MFWSCCRTKRAEPLDLQEQALPVCAQLCCPCVGIVDQRTSYHQVEHDSSSAPNINCCGLWLSTQYLGCHCLKRACEVLWQLARRGCPAEVCNFHSGACCDQQIVYLYVTVQYAKAVQVHQSLQQVSDTSSGMVLWQVSFGLCTERVLQVTEEAELEEQENATVLLSDTMKAHNAAGAGSLLHCLDLCKNLSAHATTLQKVPLHHLACKRL